MSKQNIYDNPDFFDGYARLRDNPENANILIEKPALFSLLPALDGKKILDLGCGYGENCISFSKMGANKVVGIDISEKMLNAAKKNNYSKDIKYLQMPMEDISRLNEKFDVVVSSLAVHYIADFNILIQNIYNILYDDGVLIFSQEHPLTTAPIAGAKWIRDDNGNIDHYYLVDYSRSGQRNVNWLVNDVIKYHRTFSEIMNSLISNGFTIQNVLEPLPTEDIVQKNKRYMNDFHKPDFLLIKAKKGLKSGGWME